MKKTASNQAHGKFEIVFTRIGDLFFACCNGQTARGYLSPMAALAEAEIYVDYRFTGTVRVVAVDGRVSLPVQKNGKLPKYIDLAWN